MPPNTLEIREGLKIAVRIVSGFLLFGLLLGGSLHELTHISDPLRTAQGFLGMLLAGLPFYFALRAVAVPWRSRAATAFLANAFSLVLLILLIVAAMVEDFGRNAQVASMLGLVCLPFLFNAIIFGTLWWRTRSAGEATTVSETDRPEVQPADPPSNPKTPLHTSYLLRHWQGNVPLWIAFWLNWLVIAAATTSVLRTLVKEMLYGGYPVRSIAIVSILASCGILLVWIWSAVGVWRSAARRRSKGFGRLWKILAQGIVVIGCLGTLQQLRVNTAPEIVGYAQFLVGDDLIGRPELHLSDDRRVLKMHGMLGVGTYDAFKAALNDAPTVRIIEVNSAGGRIYEAEAIAHLIRERGLDVTVVDQCLSACTFILIAGQIRVVSPLARIGFHRPSLPGLDKSVEASQVQQTLILYRNAGLPKDFISRIYETAEDDMWYPTINELIQAGVVSGRVSQFTVLDASDPYRVEKYDAALSPTKPHMRQSDSTGIR